MIKFTKIFESYEGEGPNIGLKTLFLTYDKNEGKELNIKNICTPAIYLNTDFVDIRLFKFLESIKINATYEIPLSNFLLHQTSLLKQLHGKFFVRIDVLELENSIIKKLLNNDLKNQIMIKVEATKDNLNEQLRLSNTCSDLGFITYLMPLFKEEVGELMMDFFEMVNKNVRVMPPTQFLINIK